MKFLISKLSQMVLIFLDCFKNRFGKIVELAVEWPLAHDVVDVVVDGVAAVVE